MKSIPPLAAVLVAVAGLTSGWLAGGGSGHLAGGSKSKPAGPAEAGAGASAPGSPGSGEPLSAEAGSGAAVAGKSAVAGSEEVVGAVMRAQRAMIERLRAAPLEDMTKMLTETASITDQYERRSVRELLYAHWGRMDPEGALAHMRSYEQGSQLTNYLRALIRVDRAAALQAAQAIGEDDPGEASVRAMTLEWARINPSGFMAELGNWPNHAIGAWSVHGAFQEMCRESPEGARQAVEAIKNPWVRANAGFGLTWEWARAQPEEALKYAEGQTDPELKGAALRGVLGRLAESDIDQAKALYEKHRDVIKGAHGLSSEMMLADALARRNPVEAAAFVASEVGDRQRAHYATNALIPQLGNADMAEWVKVLDTAKVTDGVTIQPADPWKGFAEVVSLPASPGRDLVMNQLAQQIAGMDARRAMEAAAAAGPEAATLIAPLAAESMIDRVEPEGFGQAASRLAEEDRGFFYTRMSDALGGTSPSKLEAFINQIPDAGAQAQSRVLAANHWTTYQPALALDFVARQPEAEHAILTGNVAYTWTGQDAWAASQWVGSLEGGDVRDTAVWAMGSRLAQDEPDSALAWTATIANPAMREHALISILGQWQQDDPQAARAAAASVPLSEDSRRRLQAIFQSEEGGN